jgi:predicted DNA-binding transcriptional regulator AlpA
MTQKMLELIDQAIDKEIVESTFPRPVKLWLVGKYQQEVRERYESLLTDEERLRLVARLEREETILHTTR